MILNIVLYIGYKSIFSLVLLLKSVLDFDINKSVIISNTILFQGLFGINIRTNSLIIIIYNDL